MVWNEGGFQTVKGKSVGHNYRAPCGLLLENGATKKWHVLITRGATLPHKEEKKLGTGCNQSVVPLRLFAGSKAEDRKALDTVGFLGVTGFDEVDVKGVLTLRASDDSTGETLLLGPSHKTSIVRKIFDPSYTTVK